MTVNVARRTRRRSPSAATPPMVAPGESMTIGEIDQTVFDCPSCTRPLALGSRRCPGCGTRLVAGVALSRVRGFVAAGLVIGLLAGGGTGYLLGVIQAAGSAGPGGNGAPIVVLPSPAASGVPASATPSAPPAAGPSAAGGDAITPASRAAMIQAVGANDRLAADRAALLAVLAEPTFDASAAARVFRTISADSVYGQQLASRIVTWAGAGEVGSEMAAFYGRVHDIAGEALVASVRNERAYRVAAAAMTAQLGGLPALEAAVRSAATGAGVVLPAPSPAPSPAP